MRKLNSRFLLLLLVIAVGVGAGIFVVHLFQASAIAEGLLTQVSRAESEGRLDEAAKYLRRYLEFSPKDNAERAHLAEILGSEKLAAPRRTREQAFFLLEQVLLKEPDRHESRKLAVRMALLLRKPDQAQEHLKVLLKAKPDDGETERLQAECAEVQGQIAEAVAWYRKAVQHEPKRIENYVRLSELLRRPFDPLRIEQHTREADEVLDQLVQANDADSRAYLARWRQRKAAGKADPADVEKAMRLSPNEADVLLAASEVARDAKDVDKARGFLRQGREAYPRDARFYQSLAVLELSQNQLEPAIAELKRGIQELRGQGQLDLLWTLANVYLDAKQVRETENLLTQMRQLNAPAATLDYLTGRQWIVEGKWAEAARILERIRPQLEGSAELARQVDQLLGLCYEQTADSGRRILMCKRVVQANPTSVTARLRLLAANQAAGRLEDALHDYRELVKLPDAPAESLVGLARLLIIRQSQRGSRDWKDAETALLAAEKANSPREKVVVARAELLGAQGNLVQARALLEKARTESRAVELWLVGAAFAERDGKPEDARRLLNEALRECADKVEPRLARMSLAVEHGESGAVDFLKLMEADLGRFSGLDHTRLLYGLAESHYRLGRREDARRLWNRLAELPEYRNDPRLRLFLFDLALKAKDENGMKQVLAELKRIEGGTGPFHNYCEAARLLAKARAGGDPGALAQARTHLNAAATERPNWAAIPLAQGELEELLNNPRQALTQYRRAHELGERNPRFIRRLVELLNREQQYAEAEGLLRTMQQQAPLTLELQRIAVETHIRGGNSDRALPLIHEMRLDESSDYREHLWLGQVLAGGERSVEAERHLRKAVELARDVPEVWVALVQHLARVGKKPDAETVMASLKSHLNPESAQLALAQCQDALGKYEAAREQYQLALAAQPENVAVVRNAAGFYLRWNRPKAAEPLLRTLSEGKLKAADADVVWARHGLAMVLAASGDFTQLPKALELVGLRTERDGSIVDSGAPVSFEQRYAQARVLATQPRRATRSKAIAILEELNQRRGLNAEDQFLLARLYEEEGTAPARAKAQDGYRRLATAPGSPPAYVAQYALLLIRQKQLDEAQKTVDSLVKLEQARGPEPGAYGSIELRAKLLEARGDGTGAIQLLEEQATRHADRPDKVFALVEALTRQKRTREALDRCEAAWKNCPPELVGAASLGVLRMAQPAAEDYARVERALLSAREGHPESIGVCMHLARLYEMREQFPQAEALYREVLERDPNNVIALNNLAWLLAQQPTRSAEALRFIARAIDRAGPTANLLDTRGAVHLNHDKADLAVADLEAATADSPSPSGYFRLARAQQMAKRRDAALTAFQKAKTAGLDPRQLHPAERVAYVQMARDFEQR